MYNAGDILITPLGGSSDRLGCFLWDNNNIKKYGAVGDGVTSDTAATDLAVASNKPIFYPKGYYPNSRDASFYSYPDMRNRSSGFKIKYGLPSQPVADFMPLVMAEKVSNLQRTEGGPKYFDIAMYGQMTLDATATAFGIGIGGHIRSSAGDVATSGKSVDGIAVHGQGKAIGKNGRVWGLWGQAANGDDGSGVRSSQLVGCELNLVNLFAGQPHHENLPSGEGPYRGLIVTTADGGAACGIGVDIGNGSGLGLGNGGGFWTGIRARADGIVPAGSSWETTYLEDTQQIKVEGASSNLYRGGGIRIGPNNSGGGNNFTYGINFANAAFQNSAAMVLNATDRIYLGPTTDSRYIGYNGTIFDFRNMNIGINGTKLLGARKTGWGLISGFIGTRTRSGFDTATVTTAQLAERFVALLDDIQNHGLVGA